MKANNGMEQVEEEEEKCQIFFRQTDKCRSLSRLFVYYSLFFSFFCSGTLRQTKHGCLFRIRFSKEQLEFTAASMQKSWLKKVKT